MSARFRVAVVGKSRCKWSNEAVADYTKRMRRWGGVDEISVKAEKFRGNVDAVREAESARLLAAQRGLLVVLDERGEDLDTHSFAAKLDGLRNEAQVTFALGGAYGHDASLRKAARLNLRLSSMVLNHEVARVVLYEQLYRALTILEGVPYHH